MNTEKQSQLEPLYDKKVDCPFCGKRFTTKKVRSRFIKPLRVDSDFCPIFSNGSHSPLYYYVVICPECGFAFTEDFTSYFSHVSRDNVNKEITAKMDKNVNYCGERSFESSIRTYKLAIYSAQLVKEKHIVFAHLCLRLAWAYRGNGDSQEESRFLKLALNEYEKAFINSDFDSEKIPEMQVLYMIGELNRRLGNYSEAVKFFTAVTEHGDKSKNMKYVNIAREQWKLAVEENRIKRKA
ncbi:MAG: hypothetical protein APF84_04785 [Gracilibacter sp. BRH_c7a]|nr:MAG: hypothetical protein APF84_04785 [Gracilibacter sp. BRH_c7a]